MIGLRTGVAIILLTGLSACASTADPGPYNLLPDRAALKQSDIYEYETYLPAKDFLPPSLMSGSHHTVAPDVYNDGYANSYEIRTNDAVYIAQGTDKAVERIYEIEAIQRVKAQSTPEVIGATVVGKAKTLVDTPRRLVKSGSKRVKAVDSTKDALLLVPSGVGDIMMDLGSGVYELGKTSVAVAKDGTESAKDGGCTGIDCARATGGVARTGFDEISGKASKARRLHRELGTDPYSDNSILQQQVNRVAYSKTFSGLGLSAGLGMAGLPPPVNAYRSGVGLYKRGERLIEYTDPYKRKKQDRKTLKLWGNSDAAIDRLYANKLYSPTSRTRLIGALSRIDDTQARRSLFDRAAMANTDYLIRSNLKSVQHLSELEDKYPRGKFITHLNFPAFARSDDELLIIFTADHLRWKPEFEQAVERLISDPALSRYRQISMDLIGRASPYTRTQLRDRKIALNEINPAL